MADINWAVDPSTTRSATTSGSGPSGSGTETGSAANCFDENNTTYLGRTNGTVIPNPPPASVTITGTATFASPITLTRLRVYHAVLAYGTHDVSYSWSLQYQDGSGWNTISSASGGSNAGNDVDTDNTGLSYTNVTAVKYTATGAGGGIPQGWMFPGSPQIPGAPATPAV
jgi:hypothetical protein